MQMLQSMADKVITAGQKAVKPAESEAGGIAERAKNVDEYKSATAAPAAPEAAKPAAADRINPKAKYGDRPKEERIDTSSMTKPLGSFKKGTDYVPKTGNYKLHEGEAVVTKEENMHKSAMDATHKALAGEDKVPEKKIKHIVHRRGADGSHIFEHHHTHPEHHKMEEHTKPDTDSAVEHFMEHGTSPNQGEPEAEAGNPEAASAMSPAAPAAGAAPAAPMAGM